MKSLAWWQWATLVLLVVVCAWVLWRDINDGVCLGPEDGARGTPPAGCLFQ